MINFLSINRKRLNESEDDLGWADDILKSEIRVKDTNIPLGTKVKVKIKWAEDSPCPSGDDEHIEGDYYIGTVVHFGEEEDNKNSFIVKLDGPMGHWQSSCGWRCKMEFNYIGDEKCWWVSPIDDEIYVYDGKNLNESEEDEFEWARDVINSPIKDVVEGQYYRVNGEMAHLPFYFNLDIFVKKISGSSVYYDSLCDSDDPDDMRDNNSIDDDTPYEHAKKLVETGYWVPITKEESLFNQQNINESEDLEWAQDIVNDDVYKWGNIRSYLNDGDIISVTGNICDSEGEVDLVLNNEPFIVKRGTKTALRWSNDLDKRPTGWETVTQLNKDWIEMSVSTAEWDNLLDIRILKKEETPF